MLEIKRIAAQGRERGRHRNIVTDRTTIPFDSIGDIELSRATIYYIVTTYDKEHAERYRVYTKLDAQAKDLIDALKTVTGRRTASGPQ